MKKVFKVIGDIVIALVVVFAVLMTVMVITSSKTDTGLPNVGGKALFNVLTDSMDKPGGFPAGSLIVIDVLDPEQRANLKVNDVISYHTSYQGTRFIDTHRIIEVIDKDGAIYYRTKGDNTVTYDEEAVYSGNVVGVWTGQRLDKLGKILDFLQSPEGFLFCIVIPMAIFFFFELWRFIATFAETKRRKAVADINAAEDEIKAKAIAEYLAQQQAKDGDKADGEKKDDVPAAPAPEPPKQKTEEEIKQEAIAEFLAKQAAEKTETSGKKE